MKKWLLKIIVISLIKKNKKDISIKWKTKKWNVVSYNTFTPKGEKNE